MTEEGQSYEGKCSTHGQPLSAAGASLQRHIAHLGEIRTSRSLSFRSGKIVCRP